MTSVLVRARRAAVPMFATLFLLSACSGEEGPTYPASFDPAGLRADLTVASALYSAPATESFGAAGFMIDFALGGFGGGGFMFESPALLLSGPIKTNAPTAARLRAQANVSMANALPAEAIGRTFEFDLTLNEYVVGTRRGAPTNGVRFVLYSMDPEFDLPLEPLVETGYVDLSRTGTGNNTVALVEVFGTGPSPMKYLEYSAKFSGTALEMAGFAQNASDRLAFSLKTSFSLTTETVIVIWRTSMPSRNLVTRLRQTFVDGDNPRYGIDAAVISPSGYIDLDGTIREFSGGVLVVKVNGQTFARMELASGEDELPSITNASGGPLTAQEEETLGQIFLWFAGVFLTYIKLLAPLGALLDIAV